MNTHSSSVPMKDRCLRQRRQRMKERLKEKDFETKVGTQIPQMRPHGALTMVPLAPWSGGQKSL